MGAREQLQPELVYVESDIPPEMTLADYRAHRARRAPSPAGQGAAAISFLLQRA